MSNKDDVSRSTPPEAYELGREDGASEAQRELTSLRTELATVNAVSGKLMIARDHWRAEAVRLRQELQARVGEIVKQVEVHVIHSMDKVVVLVDQSFKNEHLRQLHDGLTVSCRFWFNEAMDRLRKIRFEDREYYLVGETDGAVVVRPFDYEHGLMSYAHLYPDGRLMRHNHQIGQFGVDVEFTDEYVDAEPKEDRFYEMFAGHSWPWQW